MHCIAMDVAGALPVPRREALGEHAHDGVEVGALQRRVGPGAADEREQRVLAPFAAGGLGDDLLREDVERRGDDAQRIELAAAHRVEQRGAFDELVARLREEARLRHAADGVAGAAGALQEGRDRARRAELADEVDVADVEAELERRRRHEHLEPALLQALLGVEAGFLGKAAVVRRHRLLAEPVAEVARRALGHAPGVDEDERRAVQRARARRCGRRPAPTGRSTSLRPGASAAARGRGRAAWRSRCRRSRSRRGRWSRQRRRRGSVRLRRSASASPTGRCAGAAARPALAGVRASMRGGCRACSRRRHGSRRR